jgi:NAD(P)H-dependent FMN reductase
VSSRGTYIRAGTAGKPLVNFAPERAGVPPCCAAMPATTAVLAISGSLRAHSSNTELLRACALVAPVDVRVELYQGLATLPHFNADLDTADPPADVAAWRARIATADALLVSSPEYARGVPGTLKNALDWLVGSSDVVGKPVALLNGSPRASHAQASLALTLRTISARLIRELRTVLRDLTAAARSPATPA